MTITIQISDKGIRLEGSADIPMMTLIKVSKAVPVKKITQILNIQPKTP